MSLFALPPWFRCKQTCDLCARLLSEHPMHSSEGISGFAYHCIGAYAMNFMGITCVSRKKKYFGDALALVKPTKDKFAPGICTIKQSRWKITVHFFAIYGTVDLVHGWYNRYVCPDISYGVDRYFRVIYKRSIRNIVGIVIVLSCSFCLHTMKNSGDVAVTLLFYDPAFNYLNKIMNINSLI